MNNQPNLAYHSDPLDPGSGSVRVCNLEPDLVSLLHGRARSGSLPRSILRVRVAEPEVPGAEQQLPDVVGRYQVLESGLQFIPYFPFERDVEYRAVFDARPLDASVMVEPLTIKFLIATEQNARALTEVMRIFPSCHLLPENLLRFYICFSNSMGRGRALEEISLLDSNGQPVADALYRPPVELWDRGMQRLTVLMDPGRLKRWVGPNVKLGPPLKVGHEYILEIGSGMIDLLGRPLRARVRKHFLASDPIREAISVEDWEILPPVTGSREALVLMFPTPLDRALLLQTITVTSADGPVIDGLIEVDQFERRWSFTPTSPWIAGVYQIRVASSLEDVCGNSITGAFDRPLRKDPDRITETRDSSLFFQLMSQLAAKRRAGTTVRVRGCLAQGAREQAGTWLE